jgi:hypothetical protein
MGEAAVRSGGIAAFLAAVFTILSYPLAVIVPGPVLAYVLVPVVYALTVWVLWTTKALFARCGFRSANTLLWVLIVFPVLVFIYGFAIERAGHIQRFAEAKYESLATAIVVLAGAVFGWALLGVAFGVNAVLFGPRAPGPWRAAGIVYIVGWSIFAIFPLGFLYEATGPLRGEDSGPTWWPVYGFVFVLVGAAVVAAGWICHGIGLVMGAAKMSQP